MFSDDYGPQVEKRCCKRTQSGLGVHCAQFQELRDVLRALVELVSMEKTHCQVDSQLMVSSLKLIDLIKGFTVVLFFYNHLRHFSSQLLPYNHFGYTFYNSINAHNNGRAYLGPLCPAIS